MKSKFGWLVGGIVAFLIFAIAYMPAIQVIGRVDLPKNVSISGVSGTLWTGKAQTIVVNGLPINNVNWELSPLALLIGNVSAHVKAGNIRDVNDIAFEGPFKTSLFNTNKIETTNFSVYLPVDRVLAQVNLPLPVNASGRFKVKLDELTFGPQCVALQGTGDWLNAAVAGTQGPIDFGTYSAKLRCMGDDIGIVVSEPNLLGLSIDAVVSPDMKKVKVDGKFKPDDSLPQEVHQASKFFGQPDANGYIAIKLQ
ncbi:type II secretion system protein N [Alteromonas sp. CI.11.F.A3]|uniref:type II secretion system protein N n=1 Tax=Alteromonas sp. CI.11.F.A3 TaxID=3079555 RepID=UPI002943C4C6|nr:type II secretion system protein N [Alteromonas sp. CI.11.F.A3]WOI37684.1 type II secretion system protein N [Alteromonas sp. CI.11.F.A3]